MGGSFTNYLDFDPDPTNSVPVFAPNTSNSFVAKYDSTGQALWAVSLTANV